MFPYDAYPAFYGNPAIQAIAPKPRWTYSDADKIPVDLFELRVRSRRVGANPETPFSTGRLEELIALIPDIPNHAYYLDCLQDGLICIDIESSASDETKQRFLSLPWLYAETSLSGKGIHLIMPMPKNFHDFPNASAKTVIKSPDSTWEILMEHWVTFTRCTLPITPGTGSWEDAWAEIASNVRVMTRLDIEVEQSRPHVNPTRYRQLKQACVRDFIRKADGSPGPLSPDAYGSDLSRYEFATACRIRNSLMFAMKISPVSNPRDELPEAALPWVIYDVMEELVAADILEYREKHDQTRDGLPWLLYIAREALSKYEGPQNQEGDNAC